MGGLSAEPEVSRYAEIIFLYSAASAASRHTLGRRLKRLPKPVTLWLIGATSIRSIGNTICTKAATATCAISLAFGRSLDWPRPRRGIASSSPPVTTTLHLQPQRGERDDQLRLLDGRCTLALALGDFQRQALAGQQPTSATLKRGRKNRTWTCIKEDAPNRPRRILPPSCVDVGLRHSQIPQAV